MTTISEFEQLLKSNISQLNMTPGEIIPATVIDIKMILSLQMLALNLKV
jgi:hypothetical protein